MILVLIDKCSIITDAVLSKSQDKVKVGEPLTLSLSFKIIGDIREVFDQKNWERAYNQHDNGFRMTIHVNLKSRRKTIIALKFVKKAVLFWARSHQIPYRIWVSIIKDDMLFYPLTVQEAKSLLLDINKLIELNGNDLNPGNHKLFAEINVSWGKHNYTQPTVIAGKSNVIEVTCIE